MTGADLPENDDAGGGVSGDGPVEAFNDGFENVPAAEPGNDAAGEPEDAAAEEFEDDAVGEPEDGAAGDPGNEAAAWSEG